MSNLVMPPGPQGPPGPAGPAGPKGGTPSVLPIIGTIIGVAFVLWLFWEYRWSRNIGATARPQQQQDIRVIQQVYPPRRVRPTPTPNPCYRYWSEARQSWIYTCE